MIFLQLAVCVFQDEDSWLHCTLCRSGRQGVSTLNKALLRKVEWPPQRNTSLHSMEVFNLQYSLSNSVVLFSCVDHNKERYVSYLFLSGFEFWR